MAEKHWKSWYKPPISRIIPPILQTYTSFPYKISPAFPVRFSAFPHKMDDTLSCPQRKRGQKTRTGHYIVPFIRCPYTQRDQYIAPNPLSAHKRCKERDNNMPLLLCLRIRKGQYIIPSMHCLSARKGQYYVPLIFAAFPHVFHKRDNILPPLIYFPSFT